MTANRRSSVVMETNLLKIDQLNLRLPGLTPQQAHRLGHEVAQKLARRLPANLSAAQLDVLDLRLSIPPGTPQNRMADLVVEAIVKRIG